MAIRAPSLISV